MSMHVIEDLVSDSIQALDKLAPADDDRPRDWFTALYAFQRDFDCSNTMGRVEEILVRRRHTYRFPQADFPEHVGITEFTELGPGFDEDDAYDPGLPDGYVDPPWLYCEAGTPMWQRMVEAGRLEGPDAVPPHAIRLVDVVLELARSGDDPELIALWYGLGHANLVGGTPLTPEDLEANPSVRELRALMVSTGAAAVELPEGYRPTAEQLEVLDDELETWWYDLSAVRS
ncbi:hypothetical protein [Dactylosporangium sp. NPDC051541]|uniref:hypothetical protein n=1 Tax=Dactylosporangium sp. NPDC051541 TaxID=3363977 RepID=UPI003788FC84